MKNELNIGSISLPTTAVTKTFAILAKKGAGKSYTAGVMMEEMHDNGLPFVVFDPIDVYWGLRLQADGKTAGMKDVVVFGVLDNADIQLTDDMGAQIAQAIVENNISCVISTFGMSKKGMRKLITEFSEELLRINKTPRHIFVEEAHEFVPQRIGMDMGRVFSAVESLVVMGRNRGLGVTLINQRAATINKDVLTQIDTLFAFRNTSPHDRKALQEWVEIHAETELFTEFWNSLPSLPTGEGWIWSPEWLGKFEKVKIRPRRTFHPDREKMEIGMEMPKLQQGDITAFIEAFNNREQDVPKKVVKARKEVLDLKHEHDVEERKATHAIGVDMGFGDDKSVETHWVSQEEHDRVISVNKKALEDKDKEIEELRRLLKQKESAISIAKRVLNGEHVENSPKASDKSTVIEMWLDKIGRNNSAGKILSVLHAKQGIRFTKYQLRTMVGISAKSSGFSAGISLLKRNNLVREENGFVIINPEIT